MKKFLLFSVCIFIATITFAQAPEMLNYQAVVRNASGELIKSSSVSFRISILKGSETGTAAYTETHNATTNSQGIVNLKIGDGTTSDNFANIDWSSDKFFIKVEMDPAGGTAYSHYSTSQLLSVPYALSSKNADMLDGQGSVYYTNANNINSGSLDYARYNSYGELADAGRLDNSAGGDILERYQADTMYNAQVAFYAYNTASDNVTTVNPTHLEFNGEKFDVGNDFNTTTDLFKAPYKGIYEFNVGVMAGSINAGDRVTIMLQVNDADYTNIIFNQTVDSDNQSLVGSVTLALSAGDTVGLTIDTLSDNAYTVYGSSKGLYTYFTGHIVFRRF